MLLSSQDLGAALRAKRRAAGLTQADLAQRAGCRRQTIVAIEAGHSVQSHALIAVLTALEQGLLLVDAGAGQVLAAIAREAGGLTDEEGPSSRVRASSPQPAQRVLINPVPSLRQATPPAYLTGYSFLNNIFSIAFLACHYGGWTLKRAARKSRKPSLAKYPAGLRRESGPHEG